MMWKAWEMSRQYVAEPEEEIGVIDEGDPDSFEIIRGAEDADFEVKGKNIERLVAMTNFDNEEALYRFQLIWKRLKIEEALLEAGIQEGRRYAFWTWCSIIRRASGLTKNKNGLLTL